MPVMPTRGGALLLGTSLNPAGGGLTVTGSVESSQHPGLALPAG